MDSLKLTIDLLPKGAWGNNLSSILPKKDWDKLRTFCYEKAKYRCAICGANGELDAHEVWDFDIKAKTQTLKDIVALCSACHGVKHFRNTTRIGYGEQAKAHFLKINNCSSLTFVSHYIKAQLLFEERNTVFRWKLNVNLDKFGGEGIEVKERNIPFINNPYDAIDWSGVNHVKPKNPSPNKEYAVLLLSDEEIDSGNVKNAIGYFATENIDEDNTVVFNRCPSPPKIRSIAVNNYDGTITVVSDYADKIEWFKGNEIIKKKYNIGGRFTTRLSVEYLEEAHVSFKLIGEFGETRSQDFELYAEFFDYV